MKTGKFKKPVAILASVFTIIALLAPFTPALAEEVDQGPIIPIAYQTGLYAILEATVEKGAPQFCPPCKCPPCDSLEEPCKCVCTHDYICAIQPDQLTLVAKVVNPTDRFIKINPESIRFAEQGYCWWEDNGTQICKASDRQFRTEVVSKEVAPHSTTLVAIGRAPVFTIDFNGEIGPSRIYRVDMSVGPQFCIPEMLCPYNSLFASTYLGRSAEDNAEVIRLIQDIAQRVGTVDANVQQGTNDVKAAVNHAHSDLAGAVNNTNNSVLEGDKAIQRWLTEVLYPRVKEIWYAVVKRHDRIRLLTPAPKVSTAVSAKKA